MKGLVNTGHERFKSWCKWFGVDCLSSKNHSQECVKECVEIIEAHLKPWQTSVLSQRSIADDR